MLKIGRYKGVIFSRYTLKKLLNLIFVLSAVVHAGEPLLGEGVQPSNAREIISIFNSGEPLLCRGVVVDQLPDGAGDHIHSIYLDEGRYVVQINYLICIKSWHYVS